VSLPNFIVFQLAIAAAGCFTARSGQCSAYRAVVQSLPVSGPDVAFFVYRQELENLKRRSFYD